MPNKKELQLYQDEYGKVSNDHLERIYNFLDNVNEKQLVGIRNDIENNLSTKWKSP